MRISDSDVIQGWMREHFPGHRHLYFGLSGTALMFEALKPHPRAQAILPGFICPAISLMMAAAGKRVVHIDSDPATLHIDAAKLRSYLTTQNSAGCVLLIDHSFGYAFTGLARIREEFPQLLIIEDCARALSLTVDGREPGEASDWLLFSMYKTVTGSSHGAILATREPLDMRTYPAAATTLHERAASHAPLRFANDLLRRWRPAFGNSELPSWQPVYGSPSPLSMTRFADQLRRSDKLLDERQAIAEQLTSNLPSICGIDCVAPSRGSAGHFVSFTISKNRDAVLEKLHRKGLELSRTWSALPCDYEALAETFPCGSAGTEYLGEHIAQVPVRMFLNPSKVSALMNALKTCEPIDRHLL